MNISYNWLKQYINIDIAPEEVSKKLTSLGLEVGSVETVETIKGNLEGLVVAEVLECEKHPDADRLHITKVDIGNEESPLQIVCGAPNCRKGLKVVLATIGTKLYSGDEVFTIKRSKIRGVESMGMLCAEDEIGVGSSHDGIIELPLETKTGTLIKDIYHIENETVFEVDITPNRIDAASHFGVARDLSAVLSLTDKNIQLTKPSVENFKVDNTDYVVNVTVDNTEKCPRYCGITLNNITVKESPEWLKKHLTSIGLRPINNVVDVTNFILHEMGQPLHAFDGDKIEGNQIHVKTLPEKTKFTTLDGVERTISAEDLMICNANEGMCMAGVFGGLDSGVTEKTTKVFIESAYFNPVSIRKTARRHGLNTDSSFRFERGIDPNNTIYSLKRAALLIKEVAGGEISSNIIDIYPNKIEDFKVTVSYEKIYNLIGKEIEKETIKAILKGLEITIEKEENNILYLSIPAYRVDVQRDVDVIEDILRVYGYNNIIPTSSLKSAITYSKQPNSNKLQNLIAEQLTGSGFYEIINNSLTKISYYTPLTKYSLDKGVKLMNPLSSDLGVMRQTLLFGGLESIAYNRNRKNANLKFYEFGNCYHFNSGNKNPEKILSAYSEEFHLGLWITGNKSKQSWIEGERKTSFFDLKAYVENILTRLGVPNYNLETIDLEDELFDSALKIQTRSKETVVVLGLVSQKQLKQFDIDTEVFFADFKWETMLKLLNKQKVNYKEISKFQGVKRDLALLLDKETRFDEIERLAFATEKKLLKEVSLFDVYEGKNIEQGKKSYAVSFIIQDENKTLEESQIENIMQKLIHTFEEKLGAKIRQ